MKTFLWCIATYLIIGIVVTLQNSLGEENRELMRKHGVGIPELILGIIIGPIGYIWWELERIRERKRNENN